MDLATASESADEWEPCSVDGFIHKRKRRRIDPSSAAPSPADSGVAEEKFRRDRRKRTLLGVKGRYQRELALWEKLSVTCRAKQDNVEQLPREREGEETDRTRPPGGRPEAEVLGKEDGLEASMGGLLLEADAQEVIIQDVSTLCDIAESSCKAHTEKFRQSLIDLPIWASRQDLLAALSYD